MYKQLVVSHYEQSLVWTSDMSKSVNTVIYDKSINETELAKLPNVGREPHTYMHHIVENYNSLAEWTIFAQDNPFEHVNSWADIVLGDETTWNEHAVLKQPGAYFFSNLGVLNCDQTGSPHHNGLPVLDLWNRLFSRECPTTIAFAPSCHCSIHRRTILARPIEFYKNAKQLLEQVYEYPWAFERHLSYVFDISIN